MHVIPDPGRGAGVTAEQLYNLMPLQFFYARDGMDLPEFRFIEGWEMPEPERSLLVHDEDMTPRLSRHHDSKLGIRVFDKEWNDNYLLRLVVLESVSEKKIVEFGAIGIHVESFPEHVQDLIRECRRPFGGILNEEHVPHRGQPRAFFEVRADGRISNALQEPEGARLYGRCNQLVDNEGRALADIVEILPAKGESNDPPQA